jgi:hypothetical protein
MAEETNKRPRGRQRKDGTPPISKKNNPKESVAKPNEEKVVTQQKETTQKIEPVKENPPTIKVPENVPIEETDNVATANANPADYDPLDNPVIEREYTKGVQQPVNPEQIHQEIPENKVTPQAQTEKIDDKKDSTGQDKPKIENKKAEDMSNSQKRREAEKAANTIMFHYCKYSPIPFKRWASFNEKKIEQMAMEDKINLNLKFKTDKEFTVLEYVKDVNKQVEEMFSVDEETKKEIREPLIDVLMEQNLVLTPVQRLLIAVGSHLGTMAFKAWQLSAQNKQALDYFSKTYEELKKQNNPNNDQPNNGGGDEDNSNDGGDGGNGGNGGGGSDNIPETQEEESEEKIVTMDEVLEEKSETEVEEVVAEEVPENEQIITQEEFIEKSPEVEEAIIISETKKETGEKKKISTNKKENRKGKGKKGVSLGEIIDNGGNLKERGEK